MSVSQNDVGSIGTLNMAADLNTTFTGEVAEYRPGNATEHDTFLLRLGGGRSITLRAIEWDFTPIKPARSAGWYSDPKYPVSEGFVPVYVDSEGRTFIAYTHENHQEVTDAFTKPGSLINLATD